MAYTLGMVKRAYRQGVLTAIKEAQEQGLMGQLSSWASKNPTVAQGVLSQPLYSTLQTVQGIDPEAAFLRKYLKSKLTPGAPSPQPTA